MLHGKGDYPVCCVCHYSFWYAASRRMLHVLAQGKYQQNSTNQLTKHNEDDKCNGIEEANHAPSLRGCPAIAVAWSLCAAVPCQADTNELAPRIVQLEALAAAAAVAIEHGQVMKGATCGAADTWMCASVGNRRKRCGDTLTAAK